MGNVKVDLKGKYWAALIKDGLSRWVQGFYGGKEDRVSSEPGGQWGFSAKEQGVCSSGTRDLLGWFWVSCCSESHILWDDEG